MIKTIPVKVKYNTDILDFLDKLPNRISKLLTFSNALVDHTYVLLWMQWNCQSPVFTSFKFHTSVPPPPLLFHALEYILI